MANYQKKAKELKDNTEIMEATFKNCGLQILSYSFQPYSDDDADCKIIIELSSVGDNILFEGATLKVNLYDKDGEIFLNVKEYINSDFSGYDTITLTLYYNQRTLLMAKKAKIFIAK